MQLKLTRKDNIIAVAECASKDNVMSKAKQCKTNLYNIKVY